MNAMMEKDIITMENRILFVNDGSTDGTWELIRKYQKENPIFQGLSLSRNRGHQNALLAGLMTAKEKCDICISMDADLQDDIEVMDEMIEKSCEGCEVVYGVRKHRDKDTPFKRGTSLLLSAYGADECTDDTKSCRL